MQTTSFRKEGYRMIVKAAIAAVAAVVAIAGGVIVRKKLCQKAQKQEVIHINKRTVL